MSSHAVPAAASLASLLLLAACGASTPQGPATGDKQLLQQPRTDVAFADPYQLADVDCQNGAAPVVLGAEPLTFFAQGASRQVTYPFQSAASGQSLTGPGIDATFYDFYQSSACGAVGDDASCAAAHVIQDSKPLRVCRPTGPYPRTSIEGVALTSLANIATAYTYYQTLPNRSASLAPVQMLVLPTIEKTYEKNTKRTVATDNLAYAPNFGAEPVFVIYPKGVRSVQQGLWKDLNLWEMQWGLAHEFGHHVFHTHTKIDGIGGREGLDLVPGLHSYGSRSAALEEELAGRVVSGNDVLAAVNESYADLFAFYVYGGKPGLTLNVDCFEGNREVTQGSFFTGQPKVLSADVLATFFSTTGATTTNCKTPNFQDVHAIGAIYAYAVNRIFAAVAASPDARAQLLLKWAERLGDTVRASTTSQLSFDVLAKDALLTAADGSGHLPAAACAAAREAFPQYAGAWFAAGADLTCN